MTPLLTATIASEGAAALAGIALATRRREHVPAAVALSLLTIDEAARQITSGAPTLIQLDRVLFLGVVAILPGLSVYVFLRPRFRCLALACVVGAWVLACVLLAVFYQPPAYVAVQRWYLAADLAGLAVSIACLITWGWRTKRKIDLGSAQYVAVLLTSLDIGILLAPSGPWRGSLFVRSFEPTQLLILIIFAVMAIAEVVLWRISKPS